MSRKELVSVIVSIYNVEDYLNKCIDSIINQTYKNLEIILVDDGSLDNSPQICDEYSKKDNRIKVIHKQNGGLSDARNHGIEISTGKYLCFIDSDDYIDKQMIEKLYQNLKGNKSDISICNFYEAYQNGKLNYQHFPNEKLKVSGNNKFYNIYNDYGISTIIACGKIYKKELFNDIRYPIGRVHEDEVIVIDILEKTNIISYIDEPLYYYVQREKSITKTFNLKRLDIIETHEKRIKYFEKLDKNLLKLEYFSYIKGLTKIIIPGLKQINENDKLRYYKKRKKQLIQSLKNNFNNTKKEQMEIFIIEYFSILYTFICNQSFLKRIFKKIRG